MILKMFGPEKNFRFVDAAAASLLMLTLVVGPVCMGLCAGSSCVAPAKSPHTEATCHEISSNSAAHFTAKGNASGCGEANTVVSNKPNFAVKSGPAASKENIPAAVAANIAGVSSKQANAFSSGGPPCGIQATNSKALALRI